MELGAFSISLAVKDLEASRTFYEKFGFKVFAGDASQSWLIMKNGAHVIGLFQGLFEKNILTFNTGRDSNAQKLAKFTDVRELQRYEPKGCSCSSRQTRAQRGRPASSLWTRMGIRSWSISTCEQETAMKRAVFLDLNGTLVTPVLVERLDDLQLIEGVSEGVARLCQAGFVCPVVTVQSRIEKGVFTEAEFRVWFAGLARQLAAMGATVVGPYVCPHRFSAPCACKKPQTLLYEQAAADHGLELAGSYVVGDSAADIEAARRIGGRGCLLWTPRTEQGGVGADAMASYAGRSMAEIVDWIVSRGAAEKPVAADERGVASRSRARS